MQINTDIFFSNYSNLQSVHFELRQAESLGLFKSLIKEVRWGTVFVESSFS